MKSLAIGLASGLGNAVHMLPAIKALKLVGHRIALYVQTDFQTADLWRRCIYADEILEPPAALNGYQPICGNWRPPAWKNIAGTMQATLPEIHSCEWRSNFRLAEQLGWQAGPPDVLDWCRDLDRSKRWDFGIVPGCKGGTWLRKRWPGMALVAEHLQGQGYTVAVFGQEGDGVKDIPGQHVKTAQIADLPDAVAGCRVVIGTDSGLSFLASSLGIPVVMVYTATSEAKAAPVGPNRQVALSLSCRPCVSTPQWQQCQNWRCRDIQPGPVIAAAQELFSKDERRMA